MKTPAPSSIYGPVRSWRLGISLGVDLLCVDSICSLECVYCQLGKVNCLTNERQIFVSTERVLSDLKNSEWQKADVITLSGSGEPTLAKNLGEVIEKIRELTGKPVIVLTNSTLLHAAQVRAEISTADKIFCKLDAWSDEIMRRINRPYQTASLAEIVFGIRDLRREFESFLAIQTMILRTLKDAEIEKLAEHLRVIKPDEVQLNLPTRPIPPEYFVGARGNEIEIKHGFTQLKTITADELEEIRLKLADLTELPVITPSSEEAKNKSKANMHDIDMDLVGMSLDVVKFAINRITNKNPHLGFPKKEEELKALAGETITRRGIGGEKAFAIFRDTLLRSSVSIDHPRHLAFVPAAPTRAAVMFDLVTAASSVHGAFWLEGAGCIFAENEAMKWLVSLTGMPAGAFGVFTSGGTAANLSAMVTAREFWRSKDAQRREGARGIVLAARTAHSSIKAMARVIDADVLLVETEERFAAGQLEKTIGKLTPDERQRLFAVIATGGTTNAGIIDDLAGIAEVCRKEDLWFHVDAAYGGGALASPQIRPLFAGIERADSVTIDPHKWLFSPYDCGAVIYKSPELARKAHAQEGSYLDIISDERASGFNPADYQIQLTRRVRGLPLWFSLAMYGTDRYAEAVDRGIELAQVAGRLITESEHLELLREPSLSCVIFRRKGWSAEDYTHWACKNHRRGFALVLPTKWKTGGGFETVTRFCFINPDTTERDISDILATMS